MRDRTLIIVASVLVVLLLGAGSLYLYDHSRRDLIAKGVTVAGVDVGGQRASAARKTLERALTARSNQPIVVRGAGKTFKLLPRDARLGFDVRGMVDEAVARSRNGSVFARTWRSLGGSSVHADLPARLSYSKAVVNRFVKRVTRAIDRRPEDAHLSFSGSGIDKVPEREGRRVNAAQLRRGVTFDLENQRFQGVLRPLITTVRPETTTRDLARKYPRLIIIDRGGFTLRLFRNLRSFRNYSIAIGQLGYDTPSGLYSITDKTVDPNWYVPNEAWAGDRAGTVVPGGAPDNPLKARWLGFFAGRGIHGTADDASVGTAASHGCIRMHIPDVEELYDLVPVGTPVYVA